MFDALLNIYLELNYILVNFLLLYKFVILAFILVNLELEYHYCWLFFSQ